MKYTKIIVGVLATIAAFGAVLGNCDTTKEGNYEVHSSCYEGPSIKGIDVSYHQQSINWNEVRDDGIKFAFARTSDSTTKIDPRFEENWVNIKKAGIVRGAYQFFRPNQDAEIQATLFVSMLNAVGGLEDGDLPPVIDIEVNGSMSNQRIIDSVGIWIDYVEAATNRTPIIYTGPSFWDSNNLGGSYSNYPLWIAHYTTKPCPWVPDSWSKWDFWQFTGNGYVNGVGTVVDINIFAGNSEDLQRFIENSFIHTPDSGADVVKEADTDAGVDAYEDVIDDLPEDIIIDVKEETKEQLDNPGCSCQHIGR